MRKIFLLVLFFPVVVAAQVGWQSLDGYFRPPMDGVLLPSANFAETRSNHFHSGVDIKTGGVEGKQLYAAAEGYICRVNIAPGGFGKTLYINHPNGTTTVYAHMQRFTPEIEKYVKEQRYRLKRHAIDLYPVAEMFPVAKGDRIGLSGNTGSSGGPHLHYEVRDAATQEPLNPVTAGVVKFRDEIAPTIARLHYIEVDTVGIVPLNSAPRAIEVARGEGNTYTLRDTAALVVGPRGYFVLEATDHRNDTQNTMGVYKVAATMDGEALFGFALDRFNYANTRYVNSLCHFAMQRGKRNQFLRLALQADNRLPVYTKMKNRGLVMLRDGERHPVSITIYDDTGNKAVLNFTLCRRREEMAFPRDTTGIAVDCRREFTASADGLRVTIPAGALYEPIFFRHLCEEDPSIKVTRPLWSPVYTVHDARTPLHKAANISIDVPGLPAELRSKACLGIVAADGANISSMGGVYKDGTVSGNVTLFGRYCVVADVEPPTVTPNFTNGQDLRGRNSVSFTLKDDFSGIASFEATIDGEWIIFESNASRTLVTHVFDPEKFVYKGGRHTLAIVVTDNRGNRTELRREFVR